MSEQENANNQPPEMNNENNNNEEIKDSQKEELKEANGEEEMYEEMEENKDQNENEQINEQEGEEEMIENEEYINPNNEEEMIEGEDNNNNNGEEMEENYENNNNIEQEDNNENIEQIENSNNINKIVESDAQINENNNIENEENNNENNNENENNNIENNKNEVNQSEVNKESNVELEYSNSNNNIPPYNNNNNNNNKNQSDNNQYNYQPSKYSSLLPDGQLRPEDKKILEKYNDYSSKNRTYEHNNIYCNPSYLNRNISNKYNYNSFCDDDNILNKCKYEPNSCYRNYLYNKQPKCTYTYSIPSSKNNCDYRSKKVYPENILHNTKYENYHVPNSQSNYNSKIPRYNTNLKYERYYKKDDYTKNKKENNNIENPGINTQNNDININTNININLNQKSNIEPNKINNSINQQKSKYNIKDLDNSKNKYIPKIPKRNVYHFNESLDNNYIKNNISQSYKSREPKDNNIKKEINIYNSPCDYYYNTLHEKYVTRKEEEMPLKNNKNSRRTYEIDCCSMNDRNNGLLCHSNIFNGLMSKNYCYNYDYFC